MGVPDTKAEEFSVTLSKRIQKLFHMVKPYEISVFFKSKRVEYWQFNVGLPHYID